MISPDHILYEATITDPKVFSRPWKMTMPLYRRTEKNVKLLEYECVFYLQEQRYGRVQVGRVPAACRVRKDPAYIRGCRVKPVKQRHFVLIAVTLLMSVPPAHGQYAPRRTPDGQPDIQGMYTRAGSPGTRGGATGPVPWTRRTEPAVCLQPW